ncbi:ABC transporter ATP-binding protein [Sulfitobacter sp.]|jgi:iron complex transport system ATP-binding protein|uniref:ABC transporter ATP-binding protein n=1 Tax=Sulfitobacter sp. TaxID=1903071 RepID=UPI0039E363E1
MGRFTLDRFGVHVKKRSLLQIDKLDLPSCGIVGVIGPNGAGKSTFLRALAGVARHTGEKSLDGSWPSPEHVGFLPQDFTVNAALSVSECVLLGRREQLGWRVTDKDRLIVDDALARFGLTHLADRPMTSLSGGQQQLVLLAQRLSRAPRVLILDEPTSALDLRHQINVLSYLKDFHSHDTLIIVALHDLTLAGRFSNALLLIENGGLRAQGLPSEVLCPEILDPVYGISSECLQDRLGAQVVVPHMAGKSALGIGEIKTNTHP